jgi:hypothetical protein
MRGSGGSLLAGDDWYVNFSPCDEIRFTFHHLNAVTGPPELVARAAQIRRGVNAFCEYDASAAATSCSGLADVRLRAGTAVGRVFRMNQVSFNLTAIDKRAPTTPAPPLGIAIDPSRYELTYDQIVAAFTAAGEPIPRAFTPELYDQLDPSRTHARCPLDYFSPVEHDALYAMLGSYDGTVHGSGCGHVFQDNPDGGLAGGWFPEGLTDPFLLGSEVADKLRGHDFLHHLIRHAATCRPVQARRQVVPSVDDVAVGEHRAAARGEERDCRPAVCTPTLLPASAIHLLPGCSPIRVMTEAPRRYFIIC